MQVLRTDSILENQMQQKQSTLDYKGSLYASCCLTMLWPFPLPSPQNKNTWRCRWCCLRRWWGSGTASRSLRPRTTNRTKGFRRPRSTSRASPKSSDSSPTAAQSRSASSMSSKSWAGSVGNYNRFATELENTNHLVLYSGCIISGMENIMGCYLNHFGLIASEIIQHLNCAVDEAYLQLCSHTNIWNGSDRFAIPNDPVESISTMLSCWKGWFAVQLNNISIIDILERLSSSTGCFYSLWFLIESFAFYFMQIKKSLRSRQEKEEEDRNASGWNA